MDLFWGNYNGMVITVKKDTTKKDIEILESLYTTAKIFRESDVVKIKSDLINVSYSTTSLCDTIQKQNKVTKNINYSEFKFNNIDTNVKSNNLKNSNYLAQAA